MTYVRVAGLDSFAGGTGQSNNVAGISSGKTAAKGVHRPIVRKFPVDSLVGQLGGGLKQRVCQIVLRPARQP